MNGQRQREQKSRRSTSPGEVAKTQAVRVADILFIGPLMGLGGAALRRTQPLLGNVLVLLGVGTTIYNARNFTRANETMRRSRTEGA